MRRLDLRQHPSRIERGAAALGHGPLPGPHQLQPDVWPDAHERTLRGWRRPDPPVRGRFSLIPVAATVSPHENVRF
jgi:hypothetical protein